MSSSFVQWFIGHYYSGLQNSSLVQGLLVCILLISSIIQLLINKVDYLG